MTSSPLLRRIRRIVTAMLLVTAVGGCTASEVGTVGGGAPSQRSERAPVTTTVKPAAAATTDQTDWQAKEFCLRFQESVDCFEMALPSTWHLNEHRGPFEPLLVRSDVNDEDIWDASTMNGRFEVTLDEYPSGSAELPSGGDVTEDTVGGYPASRIDDRRKPSDSPWQDRWATQVTVSHGSHRYLFNMEACCGADLEAARPTLEVMDQMLASVKFKDPALAGSAWTSTIISSNRHPGNGDAGLQPPEQWVTIWGVHHPAGWRVSPIANGDDGWEVASPDGALDQGPLVVRAEPLSPMDQSTWAALPSWDRFSAGNQLHVLEDRTAGAVRTLTLLEMNQFPSTRYTVTMPDLPPQAPARHDYESLATQIITDSSNSWTHPSGYPGPGGP